MPKYADRKGENIVDFLQREGFFQRAQTLELLKNGKVSINNKVMKRESYKPKKGDYVVISPWSFIVSQ